MSTATGDQWVRELPAGLPDGVVTEIARFVDRLGEETSCLATGSLVEGLGNPNSDIDLYVIPEREQVATRPVSIGIRASRYVDCEYLSLDGVDQLVTALNRASPDQAARFALRDFDRYYRLAIAVRLTVTAAARSILQGCVRGQACRLFARWSMLRAREHLARAAVAAALADRRAAVILLREAAAWRATGLLAEDGEGYPSLKWVTVKAARRYGPDTPAYRACLDGYWTTVDSLATALPRLREHLSFTSGMFPAEPAPNWRLADGVEAVLDGEVPHLTLRSRSIVPVPGLPGLVVTRLAAGLSWQEAVRQVATALQVPAEDVGLAGAGQLRELASLGYLIGGPDEDGADDTR